MRIITICNHNLESGNCEPLVAIRTQCWERSWFAITRDPRLPGHVAVESCIEACVNGVLTYGEPGGIA